ARSGRARSEQGAGRVDARWSPRRERAPRTWGARWCEGSEAGRRAPQRGGGIAGGGSGGGMEGRPGAGSRGDRLGTGRRGAAAVGQNLARVNPEAEDVLSRLVREARQDLQRRRHLVGSDQFELAVAAYAPKDFAGALRGSRLALIAEMKQRTPSMGMLAVDYRPADIAHAYAEGGAAAISVLTHMAGFGGRPEHIRLVRAATELPILRKDFVTDPFEVAEARACGADAVLLIVAALERALLRDLVALTKSRGIAALVEVHDEDETAAALEAGAQAIGVNHRNLRDFSVDLGLTER